MQCFAIFFNHICCNAINNAVDNIILLNNFYNFYNQNFGYHGNVKSLSGQQKEGLNIRNGFNLIVCLHCVITKPVSI